MSCRGGGAVHYISIAKRCRAADRLDRTAVRIAGRRRTLRRPVVARSVLGSRPRASSIARRSGGPLVRATSRRLSRTPAFSARRRRRARGDLCNSPTAVPLCGALGRSPDDRRVSARCGPRPAFARSVRMRPGTGRGLRRRWPIQDEQLADHLHQGGAEAIGHGAADGLAFVTVVAGDAHLDQGVRSQGAVGLLQHCFGKSRCTEQHDRFQVMGARAQAQALIAAQRQSVHGA